MSEAIIAQKAPYQAELEAGRKYAWCRFGLSAKQPFCDGSHSATGIKPMIFTAEESATKWLCGCKQTASQPYCDGTHGKL
jgi:CDGSH-type Zn-finger protein